MTSWKLESTTVLALMAALLINSHALHPIFAYFSWRFLKRAKQLDTEKLAREIVCGESFFILLYCLWVEFCGEYLLDYLPVLLYCVISLIERREYSEIISTVEKNRQLKDNYLYLINNCKLYVLAYRLAELLFSVQGKGFLAAFTLFFLMRTKYGFNPFLQRLFNNTHHSIVAALSGLKPLLTAYMLFYKIIGYVGKIYLQGGRRIQMGGPARKTE